MKKFLKWAIPNILTVGLFCYWLATYSEVAHNVLIFSLWFFIVMGLLSVLFGNGDCFQEMSSISKPFMVLRCSLDLVYVLALASVGWFWTAGFLCVSILFIHARILGEKKKMDMKKKNDLESKGE